MTIKEIAKLSNVSISTVSKILNGKDHSISSETREKVLQIARDYHYVPYVNVTGVSRFLIGAVICDSEEGKLLLSGINRAASRNGYGVFCCEYRMEEESEKKAVTAMCARNVTTVLWQRGSIASMEYLSYFEEKGITVFYCDFLTEQETDRQFTLDLGRFGYEAAGYLIDRGHRRLGCCIPGREARTLRFVKGFERCLYDRGVESRPDFIVEWEQSRALGEVLLYGISALVCLNEDIAVDIYRKAVEGGYKIPRNLSLIALTNQRERRILYPRLTEICFPVERLGEYACESVIAGLEKAGSVKWDDKIEILEGDSTGGIPEHLTGKIVVVGSINMDSVIRVRDFPEAGQTCVAGGLHSYAGGKGFNQAVGAAKLGAEVVLVGKIGQDYEAKILRDAMVGYGLCVDGVSESAAGGTGKAYITVQKDGESNIIVYAGANSYLSREDIMKSRKLFQGAQFCLLPMETPMETVEYAAAVAREMGIRTVLKPAAVDKLSDALLEKIDIFVPNRKELNHLCPGGEGIEEKARYFLEKGVKEVVVTLDEHGCFWMNRETALYFKAADFEAVDTTGAADAFISALAVYLTEGMAMAQAIQYATCAAGFSITRNGVQTAMADRAVMDAYAGTVSGTITFREGEMY